MAFCSIRIGVGAGAGITACGDGAVAVVVAGTVTSKASTQTHAPPDIALRVPVTTIVRLWLALLRPVKE